MRLLTEYGYVVSWMQTDNGEWYVSGFMDALYAVTNLEEGGYVWTANENLSNVRAVRAEYIDQAWLMPDDNIMSRLPRTQGMDDGTRVEEVRAMSSPDNRLGEVPGGSEVQDMLSELRERKHSES